MNEAVFVIDPVIVAALGNGNDTVGLIDAVDAQDSIGGSALPRARSHPRVAQSFRVSITSTVSFRFPSAATITGSITNTASFT